MRLSIALTLTLLSCGCSRTQVMDSDTFHPYGPLDPKTRVLVWGRYKALHLGNHVVVYATGMFPQTSWKTDWVVEKNGPGVMELSLYGEPPMIAGQAFSPFLVSKVLDAGRTKGVRVHDSKGVHVVPIEPPEGLMTFEEYSRIQYPKATGQ